MKKIIYIILFLLLISIIFNIIYINKYNNIYKNKNIDTVEIVTRVDSFIQVDTVTKYYPKPVKIEIKDTIYISIDSIKTEGDSILLLRETKVYEDSTYKAVISGYNPKLEEITIFPRTTYIVTEKTVTVTKKERFTWGLQFGAGYGIFSRKPDIYVGIGGQINF